MKTIIKTEQLTKKYGSFAAVKSLELSIKQGEIYGFIGLNGAGKTTTIRMLLGLIKPTTGRVELFGEKASHSSAGIWSKVGFLVEKATAYPGLTVKENLESSRILYQIEDKNRVTEVMDKMNLTRYQNRKAKHLSHGNYQRMAVAKALLHQPELLILDEPTVGMDPAGIVEIRHLLQSLSEDHGVTIFISSHILGEIYRMTTRIGIILYSFIAAWVFGQDYIDQTITDLLVLPTSRTAIAAAKFTLISLWSFLYSLLTLLVGAVLGFVLKLPGFSSQLLWDGIIRYIIISLLAVLLSWVIAFIANISRSYFPAIGFAIFMIILAQIVSVLGWGEYFPWSIPALYSQIAGPAQFSLFGFLIVLITGLFGVLGTMGWWHYADHAY